MRVIYYIYQDKDDARTHQSTERRSMHFDRIVEYYGPAFLTRAEADQNIPKGKKVVPLFFGIPYNPPLD